MQIAIAKNSTASTHGSYLVMMILLTTKIRLKVQPDQFSFISGGRRLRCWTLSLRLKFDTNWQDSPGQFERGVGPDVSLDGMTDALWSLRKQKATMRSSEGFGRSSAQQHFLLLWNRADQPGLPGFTGFSCSIELAAPLGI